MRSFFFRKEEKSVNSHPHKKKASQAWKRSSRTTSCRRQLGTHSREWALLEKGEGRSSCRRCKRGFLSTASSKLELPSPGRIWVLIGPWHGPMLPRTVLSLPTTCCRFHQPGPPTGIFRADQSTLGGCVPVLPRSAAQHRSLWPLLAWRNRPVSKETQVLCQWPIGTR